MSGYQLQVNGVTCEGEGIELIFRSNWRYAFHLHADIDDCLVAALLSTDLCQEDANAKCINLVGSYECVCVPGFERVNGTCQCKLIVASA